MPVSSRVASVMAAPADGPRSRPGGPVQSGGADGGWRHAAAGHPAGRPAASLQDGHVSRRAAHGTLSARRRMHVRSSGGGAEQVGRALWSLGDDRHCSH